MSEYIIGEEDTYTDAERSEDCRQIYSDYYGTFFANPAPTTQAEVENYLSNLTYRPTGTEYYPFHVTMENDDTNPYLGAWDWTQIPFSDGAFDDPAYKEYYTNLDETTTLTTDWYQKYKDCWIKYSTSLCRYLWCNLYSQDLALLDCCAVFSCDSAFQGRTVNTDLGVWDDLGVPSVERFEFMACDTAYAMYEHYCMQKMAEFIVFHPPQYLPT